MKIIKHEHRINEFSPEILSFFNDKSMIFDIETTGFSAKTSNLYMIGCCYREGDFFHIIQFLSTGKDDEESLITAFCNLCKQFSSCITFNGLGFDIPYLIQKTETYKLENTFEEKTQLDLLKEIKNYKNILKLENLKQKTVENFLNIHRQDTFSGGELISHYLEYEKTKDSVLEKQLLLHNYEDVLGLMALLPMLSYTYALNGSFSFVDGSISSGKNYYGQLEDTLTLRANLHQGVLKPVSYGKGYFYLSLKENNLFISTPIQDGKIHVPYLNPSDYVYLIQEDIAIPKAMASTIPKNEKKKATVENCYGKFIVNESNIHSRDLFEPYMNTVIQHLLQYK